MTKGTVFELPPGTLKVDLGVNRHRTCPNQNCGRILEHGEVLHLETHQFIDLESCPAAKKLFPFPEECTTCRRANEERAMGEFLRWSTNQKLSDRLAYLERWMLNEKRNDRPTMSLNNLLIR